MYRMIIDFDRGEMRIPKDVAQALSMPTDFGWFVHRNNRQIAMKNKTVECKIPCPLSWIRTQNSRVHPTGRALLFHIRSMRDIVQS